MWASVQRIWDKKTMRPLEYSFKSIGREARPDKTLIWNPSLPMSSIVEEF
jgi:hypothetical protein